jgi:uncharacterized protein YdcH (DUF465 family)
MFGEHHDNLAIEFPEFKEKIHQLKESNAHFSKLNAEYEDVSKEVYRLEEGIENSSDDYLLQQKKKRAHLKDELYKIISSS